LQWARVQVFQKGPLFPPKNFKKNSVGQILGPPALGPRALHACTARLARPIVTPLHDNQAEKELHLHTATTKTTKKNSLKVPLKIYIYTTVSK